MNEEILEKFEDYVFGKGYNLNTIRNETSRQEEKETLNFLLDFSIAISIHFKSSLKDYFKKIEDKRKASEIARAKISHQLNKKIDIRFSVIHPLSEYNNDDIIKAFRVGNAYIIMNVYELCRPTIINMVSKNGGDTNLANEILQEAISIFYEKCMVSDFQLTSKFSTYIYAVAKNILLKKFRDNKKLVFDDDIDFTNIIVESESFIYEPDERVLGIMTEMSKLGEVCQKILKLYYIERCSFSEIAKEMNYNSEDSAKTQKYKCLTKLKKILVNNTK